MLFDMCVTPSVKYPVICANFINHLFQKVQTAFLSAIPLKNQFVNASKSWTDGNPFAFRRLTGKPHRPFRAAGSCLPVIPQESHKFPFLLK
ncbi:hypothetical protein B0X71_18520 [Planococcus lenghuensis]|uniref:Uncharacterized protein n=1 Tax=Planococcus lenghuensis TaxID=2213202 RepID=A0A1Q2L392_9BACL|nr:hypothetical protein B0X71_18520 [Planococcus lenghuensis]